jgi:PAS domain S-box-containing protein
MASQGDDMKRRNESERRDDKKSAVPSKSRVKSGKTFNPSDDQFELIFKHAPIGMYLSTIDEDRFIDVNEMYLEYTGYSREELIGRTPTDINLWVDITDREKMIKQLSQSGRVTNFELRFRAKQGNIHRGLTSAFPVNLAGHTCLLTQTNDITRQKCRDGLLQKRERFFREISENSSDVVLIVDEQGTVKYCSPSLERLAGYSPEEVTGQNAFRYLNPEDMETVAHEYQMTLASQENVLPQRTFRVLHKNGSTLFFSGMGKILLDHPDIAGVIINLQDITEKTRAQDNLIQVIENYKKFFEEHEAPLIIIDPETRAILRANHSAAGYFGWTREELLRMKMDQFCATSSGEIDDMIRKVLRREQNLFELKHCLADGSFRDAEIFSSMIKIGTGDFISMIIFDTTERKKAEAMLKANEAKYRLLADNVTDVIFTIDMNFNYTYASPSVYRLLGYTADELTTMRVEQLVDEETLTWFIGMFAEEMEIEQKPDRDLKRFRILEYQHLRKDGSRVWVENRLTFLRDENHQPTGIIGTVRDISDHKAADEALKKSQSFFKEISEHSSDIVVITDEKGVITYCSPSFTLFTGYDVKEAIGRNASTFVHPDDLRTALALFNKAARSRSEAISHELRIRHKDGSIRYFAGTGRFLLDNPYVAGVIMNINDVTERKTAEEDLRQIEKKYQTVLDDIQEGYFEMDLKGNFTFANCAVCQDLGCAMEELLGTNNREYMDEETAQRLSTLFNAIYKTGNPVKNLRWQMIRKDGSTLYTEGSISLQRDSSGNPIGFRGIAHDITEVVQAEEKLKQSEEQYRLLADHTKDAVWVTDLNLKVTYVSPSAEKLLGWTQEEIKNLPLDKLFTAESYERAMNFYSTELEKGLAAPPSYELRRTLELEFVTKDGCRLWSECMFGFLRNKKGEPVAILGESRDITERKQMENALRGSEENFRHSLDSSPMGVRIATVEGKTLYANRAILDIYGYQSLDEFENTPLAERYTPESYAEFQARKAKRLRGEKGPSEYEIIIIRKDGETRNLHVFRQDIEWNGRKQYQVIYQDITLRRQAEKKLNETLESLRQSIKITIQVLGTASEAKDPYMSGHQRRVADLARAIATEMKLSHDKIEAIRMASTIHDIGKISVPAEILCKPAILTDLEFALVKNHSQYGYDIIKEVETPWPLADIVHQHHERIDGSGYPLGLKANDILIESRILAVADVVEAMVSYRPYRPALELKIALAEIENNAGALYDRDVVTACLKLFKEKAYQLS